MTICMLKAEVVALSTSNCFLGPCAGGLSMFRPRKQGMKTHRDAMPRHFFGALRLSYKGAGFLGMQFSLPSTVTAAAI